MLMACRPVGIKDLGLYKQNQCSVNKLTAFLLFVRAIRMRDWVKPCRKNDGVNR